MPGTILVVQGLQSAPSSLCLSGLASEKRTGFSQEERKAGWEVGCAGGWEMKTVDHIAEQIFPVPKMQMYFAQTLSREIFCI